jgi:hypothetical protein
MVEIINILMFIEVPEKKSEVRIPTRIKIAEKIKEEFHRLVNGSKLLGQSIIIFNVLMD